ncbi:MAG TPA: EAL domain-containing protein [Acidobacteriaceae bacterium]|jgi:diguanylate cyclase (GGDEF)-like protein/PAS domain S-box-containing protein|nr:EAL domain-containing protein [Acidobacteriaceae bacterium]
MNGRRGPGLRIAALLLAAAPFHEAAGAAVVRISALGEDLAHVRIHDQQLFLRVLLVLVAAVLVRLLFAVRLARLVTEPVRALARVARNISEERNYSIRAQLRAAGEIGLLVGAFNEMLDQIESYDRARREAERRLRLSEERYELAARGSRDGLWDHDVAAGRTYQSARLNAMRGYPEVESWVTTVEWVSCLHPDDKERVRAEIGSFLQSNRTTNEMEYRIRHADGGYRWVVSRGIVVRTAEGRPVRVAGSERDITPSRTTDPLTGLASRLAFLELLARGAEPPQTSRHLAVLLIDIDHFRLVDESLGRAASDELLVQLTGRLRTLARWSERDGGGIPIVVARTGGDEFALLLKGGAELSEATLLAQRILELLREPFFIEGQRLSVSASIGNAGGPGENSPEELLQNAESAARAASLRGRGQLAVFHCEMRRRADVRLEVHQRLRHATEADELRLHYQPVVSLRAQRVIGFEALVRWQHPERGLMSPAEFIPVAEETDIILDLGRWVLREACRQMAEWQQAYAPHPPLSIGVNLSARQMNDPELLDLVRETLAVTGLAPERLRLEITESSVIANPDGALAMLRALRRMQVGLVIDDFGTGYSSLSYLQRLPFGTLKIDRSFVRELDGPGGTPEIVRAILSMAQSLNLRVVAEGVERRGQVQRLTALGCDLVQGYYFSPPATPEETEERIRGGLSVAGMLAFLPQPEKTSVPPAMEATHAVPGMEFSQSAAGFD